MSSLDDYLKDIGEKPTASQSTDPPAAAREPSTAESVLRGAGKSATNLGVTVAEHAPFAMIPGGTLIPPSMRSRLGDLVRQIPGVKQIEQFGQEPYENTAETIGGVGFDVGSSLAVPEIRGAGLASSMIGRMTPLARYAARSGFSPTTAGRVAGGIDRAIGRSATGAAAGAVTNPDDPITGAEGGAVGGLAPGVAGRALRGTTGQRLATNLGGFGLAFEVAQWLKHMGVPDMFAYGLPFAMFGGGHHWGGRVPPMGRATRGAVRGAFDAAGRAIEHVGPKVGGAAGGTAARAFGGGSMESGGDDTEGPGPEESQ